MKNRSTKSLARDLTLTLVLTVIVVSSVSLCMNIVFISRKAKADYSEEIRLLTANIRESMELPLWNFDAKGIDKIASIYLDNASIEYLAVRDISGTSFFEGGQRGLPEQNLSETPIVYNNQQVGSITLAFHSAPYRQGIFQLFYIQVLTAILVITALVFSILLTTRRILGRPINLLIDNINRIANGDYSIAREKFEHLEINAIIESFSGMATVVQAREKELKESGERYRTLHDNVPVGLFRTTPEGTILSANSAAAFMFGFESAEELQHCSMNDLYEESSHRESLLDRISDATMAGPAEIRFRRRDKTVFWAKLQARKTQEPTTGEIVLDGFLLDISERKTAELALKDREERLTRINRDLNVEILKRKTTEQALRNSERRMAQLIDFLPDATFAIDEKGRVLFWNRALEKMTGVMSEEMIGKGNHEYSIPFYNERRPILIDLAGHWDDALAAQYTYVTENDGVLVSESRNVPFTGGESWFWNAACPLLDHKGNYIGAIETIRNITELKRTEQEIRESVDRFRTLFESASDAILILDSENVTDCNIKAVEMFGYTREEMLTKTVSDLSPDKQPGGMNSRHEAVRRLNAALKEPVQAFEWKYRKKSGMLFDTEVSLTVVSLSSGVYIQAIVRDVTEQKRTRELMIQTEKMMSIGGLAAGMAHEINNPLGIILQSAQNTTRRLGTELARNREIAEELGLDLVALQTYLQRRSIDTYLSTIKEAGERAAKIVRSMLDFSRKSESRKAMHSLNDILDRVLEMASNDYDLKKKYDFRSVEIIREYDTIPEIMCTETEIAQVFLNLVKNAAQAMALHGCNGDTPRIILKTERMSGSVRVTITDNGPGMDAQQQKAVFEPFFTTKAPGEGTGLGLSVSYFIITTNHNGTLEVESLPGSGSTFRIDLPADPSDHMMAVS